MSGADPAWIVTDASLLLQFASVTNALSTIEPATANVRDPVAEVMPLAVVPSDQWIVHGAVPVNVNGTLTDVGAQEASIVAGSVIVGSGAMAASAVLLPLQPSRVTVTATWTLPDEP